MSGAIRGKEHMEPIREITEDERLTLGLVVGLRIPGNPMIVRCGDNRIERRECGTGKVSQKDQITSNEITGLVDKAKPEGEMTMEEQLKPDAATSTKSELIEPLDTYVAFQNTMQTYQDDADPDYYLPLNKVFKWFFDQGVLYARTRP